MSGCDYDKPKFTVFMGGEGGMKEMTPEEVRAIDSVKQAELKSDMDKLDREKREKFKADMCRLLENCVLEPLNDRILVLPELMDISASVAKTVIRDDGTVGKILGTDSTKKNAKRATNKGIVLASGPGLQLATGEFIKPCVEKGDTIMYEQFGYSEVYIDGILCHVTRAGDVMGRAKNGELLAGF